MNKHLLTALLLTLSLLTNTFSFANISTSGPTPQTHLRTIKSAPAAVQAAFAEELNMTGFSADSQPLWTRQGKLYKVSFRANGEFGPGLCIMQFTREGDLIFFDYRADDPNFLAGEE